MARTKQTANKVTAAQRAEMNRKQLAIQAIKKGKRMSAAALAKIGLAVAARKRRFRPGTVALRQIRRLQNTTHHVIPKTSMERLIREIGQQFNTDLRWKPQAIEALHVAAEQFFAGETGLFPAAQEVAATSKLITVKNNHLRTALRLKEPKLAADTGVTRTYLKNNIVALDVRRRQAKTSALSTIKKKVDSVLKSRVVLDKANEDRVVHRDGDDDNDDDHVEDGSMSDSDDEDDDEGDKEEEEEEEEGDEDSE